MTPTNLFVYGNLMRGFPLHHLLNGASFLGKAHTRKEFHLLSLGGSPMLFRGGGTEVQGEVYSSVDFEALDAVMPEWVDRIPITTILTDFQGRLFFYPADTLVLVDSKKAIGAPNLTHGDWRRWNAALSVTRGGIEEAWKFKGPGGDSRPFGVWVRMEREKKEAS